MSERPAPSLPTAEPSRGDGVPSAPQPSTGPISAAYEVIRLGPEEWGSSFATDVSEDGRVVSQAFIHPSNREFVWHTILWDAGTIVDLTAVGIAEFEWFADDGSLIVKLEDGTHAAYWAETGTLEPYEVELPTIEPPPGFAEAEVVQTNRRGESVGALYPVSAGTVEGVRGFVASDGDVIVLEPAPGGDTSVARRINDAGQVIGGPAADNTNANRPYKDGRAFLYDVRDGATTDLGTLPEFEGSMAWGLNSAGAVVGQAWRLNVNGNFRSHAFLDDPLTATMVDLNELIPANSGRVLLAALDINDAGQIVGQGMVDRINYAILLNPRPRNQTS